MRYALVSALALCALAAQAIPQGAPKRKIPCKTSENAASCYWAHGRLAVYNGLPPPLRLWKIGTTRVLAIYSGPSIKRGDQRDMLNPELPFNIKKVFTSSDDQIADFEICPLDADHPGQMQAACIESAKRISVQKVTLPTR
jgi:hypothetical protein